MTAWCGSTSSPNSSTRSTTSPSAAQSSSLSSSLPRGIQMLPELLVPVSFVSLPNFVQAFLKSIIKYTATKIPFVYSFSDNCAVSAKFSHSCDCERFIYSQDRSISCSRIGRPILEKYKSLKDIWVYMNWETEHYNSVLEITVSFLGINKWEPDIYIGFSLAFHFQCRLLWTS